MVFLWLVLVIVEEKEGLLPWNITQSTKDRWANANLLGNLKDMIIQQ